MKTILQNKAKLAFQVFIAGLLVVLLFMGYRGSNLEKFCPFGGIMSLGSKLWLGSMSCSMGSQQVFMGLVLVIGVIIFSKLFCGYICPIGTLIEWLNNLYSKVGKTITLKGIWDRGLRVGKYLLLFYTAHITLKTSELFCKKFDPFYASVSGFDGDVTLWAGVLTIFTVVFLSVFIRYFWCKYACPLSALSNIFQSSMIVVPVITLYIILAVVGVKINIMWLVFVLCIIGTAVEVFRFKFYSISPFKIKIDSNACISCKLCDKNCPQGIEVSQYEKVTHPDCTLCMDCVNACKTKDAIALTNTKFNLLPPVAIVVLVALGVFMSKQFSMTTLSEKWDDYEKVENVSTFEMEGLKNVKCYGSSKSLMTKLMRTKGIHGVDTWANQKRVRIFYDSDKLNNLDIKKAIFTPSKYRLVNYTGEEVPEKVTIYKVPVDGIFDTYDNANLIYMLRDHKDICGMATSFGEPVQIVIVYKGTEMTPEKIRRIIEQKSYQKKTKDGEKTVEVNFECATEGKITSNVTYREFLDEYFKAYDRKFNKYTEKDESKLSIYEIALPNADNSRLFRRLPYLVSHLSFDENIVRLKTLYTDKSVVQIYFVEGSMTAEEIYAKLTLEKFTVKMKNGSTKEFINPYKFNKVGRIIE